MSGLYRSGVMPMVPPLALAGHVFELLGSGDTAAEASVPARWGRCRKCLADVPWQALVEHRWVGVGFWPGMARGTCMGSVRALGSGGGWSESVRRWADATA